MEQMTESQAKMDPVRHRDVIAIVEDNADFAAQLSEFLEGYGFETHIFSSLIGLGVELQRVAPDLLVLDQFVGGYDALRYLSEIKGFFSGGLVVLTGNQESADRIIALEGGADDFVTKALDVRELLARLRAVLRRTQHAPVEMSAPVMAAGGRKWVFDSWRMELRTPDSSRIALTRAEFSAFLYMARNRLRVISRDELSQSILGREFTPMDRSVDNLMSRLRRSLEPFIGEENVIQAVRGQGYVFNGFSPEDDGGFVIQGGK